MWSLGPVIHEMIYIYRYTNNEKYIGLPRSVRPFAATSPGFLPSRARVCPSPPLPRETVSCSRLRNGTSVRRTPSCCARGLSGFASLPARPAAGETTSLFRLITQFVRLRSQRTPAALRSVAAQGCLRRWWAPFVAGAMPGAQQPTLADELHYAAPPTPCKNHKRRVWLHFFFAFALVISFTHPMQHHFIMLFNVSLAYTELKQMKCAPPPGGSMERFPDFAGAHGGSQARPKCKH